MTKKQFFILIVVTLLVSVAVYVLVAQDTDAPDAQPVLNAPVEQVDCSVCEYLPEGEQQDGCYATKECKE